MSSEFSNMKKLPYIPPTSPPPIDRVPEENDYEISDYDITGLSQKLCDEDTSVTHQPLENALDCFDVTVNSNLNAFEKNNALSQDNFLQKVETVLRANSEEEPSSSISIPPLDCEGHSLNECNISDLENDICDNYADDFDSHRDPEFNNDLKDRVESDWSRSESLCQKGNSFDKSEVSQDLDCHFLGEKLEFNAKNCELQNDSAIHVTDSKEGKETEIGKIGKNMIDKKYLNSKAELMCESSEFTSVCPNSKLVYDDGGGGIVNSTENEVNATMHIDSVKINEKIDDDEFGNFISECKVDNMEDDEFCDFISERKVDIGIKESDTKRLKLTEVTPIQNGRDESNNYVSQDDYEKNEFEESEHNSQESKNITEENSKNVTSDLTVGAEEDFGNFVGENDRNSTGDGEENFGNFVFNCCEIDTEKLDFDFGSFTGKGKDETPLKKFDNVKIQKRLSEKDYCVDDDEYSNSCEEKGREFDTDDDNDEFGDFYSTNIAEESQSELKVCQENYDDEYLYPSVRYDSPAKFAKYPDSHNDSESKEEKKESLQLEFSDDEDETLEKNHKEQSSPVEEDSLFDPGLKDNKFHWYFIRWLPKGSRTTASGSFLNFSKLNELIDGTSIWFHVKNVESCSALQFSWTNSRLNKLYLSSLNVDTRNILLGHRSKWISTIPIFAQALSFSPLTPLKPSTNSVNWNIEESSVTSQSNISFKQEENSSNSNSRQVVLQTDNKNIPPAKFDWNSSGLTNPLNMPEKELLSSLEKDFTAVTTAKEFKSSTSVIEEALKKVNYSSSTITKTQSTSQSDIQRLPPKVQQIINSIPDLNFMQSKVLAFPIGRSKEFYS